MSSDPKYVRLVDRMARSTQVDLNSGWSIAGLDVKEFPEDERAANYVRDAIRRGTVEPCSKAEYDEVNEEDFDFLGQAGVKVKDVEIEGHYQEAHVSAFAEATRHRLEAARGLNSTGSSYGDESVRKKAILRAQKKLDSGAAPEEVEEDAQGSVDPDAAAKEQEKAKKAAAKSKK